ncbi:MAG TPA: NADPH-dependent F420 reductase [Dehalococcoidia bacterium]|nr:NADPH-dependent F420 reductase [Dehalococcoidia bacterium]
MARTIGFIGGTGPEGKGLAARFARAGLEVLIGSRSAERGEETAAEVREHAGGNVRGVTNAGAAAAAEIVIVTLPYAGQSDTLTGLQAEIGNKILVSTVVPMVFGGGKVEMLTLEAGSAAQEAQRVLPEARVVGAYQNLAAKKLYNVEEDLHGDVIVCSDDKEALREIISLTEQVPGLRGVNGGPLSCSRYVEGITTLLVHINRNYKTESHVQILGV